MEIARTLAPDASYWHGKRVFLTGHSGFKGAWLALWLNELGAKVCGYSLEPDTSPNLYTLLDIPSHCAQNHLADIRDYETLTSAMRAFKPDIVIHMAAQSLVRRSYREPLTTVSSNIDGTANMLEACRHQESVRAALIITTDKCYRNKETLAPYRESDELGGRDVYSASKACAEIVTEAWRQSFFAEPTAACIVSARAGNVIGGGDWNEDRLIPDAARAFSTGKILEIRAPKAIRPWQHVAEPLLGYLMLARAMEQRLMPLSSAYNFGPNKESIVEVERVVQNFASCWQPAGQWKITPTSPALHEAKLLLLDSMLAKKELGWQPMLRFEEAMAHTADWYRAYYAKEAPAKLARTMLDLFETTAGRATQAAARVKIA